MHAKIKTGLKFCCCWGLLLHMLNLSIDPVRHQNQINGELTFAEDLKINKIESVYELISEHIFKKDVPETQNAQDHSISKSIIFIYQPSNPFSILQLEGKPVEHNHSYLALLSNLSQVLESPPPRHFKNSRNS